MACFCGQSARCLAALNFPGCTMMGKRNQRGSVLRGSTDPQYYRFKSNFAGSPLYHGSSAIAAVAHRPTPASGRAVVTCSYSFEGHWGIELQTPGVVYWVLESSRR